MPSLRTLLVLGRASNLPTVWSNCLAGWWLGGRGSLAKLLWLLLAASLLYVGGMFLNDAFDAHFDAQNRRERPIPSGAISVGLVWKFGLGLLGLGFLILCCLGGTTGVLGFLLVICILIYDAVHKLITLSPILMAICRWLLYLLAGSVTAEGLSGWPVWCGFALACYVAGLSFVARKESSRGEINPWSCGLLAVPIGLAFMMNVGRFRENAWLLSLALGLWILLALRGLLWSGDKNIGRAVSILLAGIVLVDLLAVADASRSFAVLLVALLLLALFLQRFLPAT
jgi:4-hydroxybenzoate polyprenyltransferase